MSDVIQSCISCKRAGTRWLPTTPPTCPQCHATVNFAGNQETLGEFAYKYRREVLMQEIKELEEQAKVFIKRLEQEQALDELAKLTQELGLYDELPKNEDNGA